MKYIDLTIEEQRDICSFVEDEVGLSSQIIEKDWWVTTVLRALFNLPYADSLSFKGGTSLSKCFSIINRFSEDADIAIDREYLGFVGELSKNQISDKLRRATCSFVREKLQFDLKESLIKNGIDVSKFDVKVNITSITTTDPEIIEVEYASAFQPLPYIKQKVIVEVSGRSMSEPTTKVDICSLIDSVYNNAPFAEENVNVKAVLVERTFIEKLCLLHEELSKSSELIRTERMSRHLYDVVQIAESDYADRAFSDKSLFYSIIEHRSKFIRLKGFDYKTLDPKSICIVPSGNILELWREDYRKMQESMIYGHSYEFDELIEKLKQLNKKINEWC